MTRSSLRTDPPAAPPRSPRSVHPVVMLLSVLVLCAVLTWTLDSGSYERAGSEVLPGTYQVIDKSLDVGHLLGLPADGDVARPAGLITIVQAIPLGLAHYAPLIFMVMIVGGMFGVFRRSGALDAGLDRLVHRVHGNVYLLAPVMMCAFAAGSAFLGLMSEYLAVLPVLLALAERLRLSPLHAVAMLVIAAKIGYIASVSNPVVLPIAQGITEVPIFSGAGLRLAVLVVFIALGILYYLHRVRRSGFVRAEFSASQAPLPARHLAVLILLCLAVALMVYGGRTWHWHYNEFSAYYIAVTILIAATAGLAPRASAEAFIDGIKTMILPSLLIGLAGAIYVLLRDALVLDTVVHAMARVIDGRSPWQTSVAIMLTEAGLDVMIPSTSAKAAISIPILWPIGQLADLSGNAVVLAFLFGNGLMATVSPTSGVLLAMLAMARVPFGAWFRFMLPLTLVLSVVAVGFLFLATASGY